MIGGAERVRVVVELQAQQLGSRLPARRALHIAPDVVVEFVQPAHDLAHVLVGLRHGQRRREALVFLREQLMGGVELAGELARLLFLDGAKGLQQRECVVRQDDGFGVIGVLFALDPAGFGQPAQDVSGVFLLARLPGQPGTRSVPIQLQFGLQRGLQALRPEIVDDLVQHRVARQAKAIELSQSVQAQQDDHVMAL